MQKCVVITHLSALPWHVTSCFTCFNHEIVLLYAWSLPKANQHPRMSYLIPTLIFKVCNVIKVHVNVYIIYALRATWYVQAMLFLREHDIQVSVNGLRSGILFFESFRIRKSQWRKCSDIFYKETCFIYHRGTDILVYLYLNIYI